MTITRDGLLVASGTTNEDIGAEHDPRGTIQVWDIASANLVKTSPEFVAVGDVSPDGRFMAPEPSSDEGNAADQNSGIVITDLSTGRVKWTLRQLRPARLFFSPDSQELAVTNGSDQGFTVSSLDVLCG